MESSEVYDIIIVGGGLAGLYNSIVLAKAGFSVLLIEKHAYPIQKVCGEYVSNEVRGLLEAVGFNPEQFNASQIEELSISSVMGNVYKSKLPLGGFGISRFVMDEELSKIAVQSGVKMISRCTVLSTEQEGSRYIVNTTVGFYKSKLVIGAYGKRSTLDKTLGRSFMEKRTGFIGVKYHARLRFPRNEIALHSFKNGYCGIVKIEKDLYNICYLYKRRSATSDSIADIEDQYVKQNPFLLEIFSTADFVSKTPLAISEIYFGQKELYNADMIFCGDAAGLISPLCGNGMAMAIHSAKMLSTAIISNYSGEKFNRDEIVRHYSQSWNKTFSTRIKAGRVLQYFFLNPTWNPFILQSMYAIPGLDKKIIKLTHGRQAV